MSAEAQQPALPRLPREVEESGRGDAVRRALAAHALRLGPAGPRPLLPLAPALVDALRRARVRGRLAPGLEPAEDSLEQERAGLAAVDARTGRPRARRISRLALVSRDAADRLQRRLARLAERHADRLLLLVLDAEGRAIGRALFGREKETKLLLVSHKQAVAEVLLALAPEGEVVPPGAA